MSFCIIQARDDCGVSSEKVEKQLAVGGIVERCWESESSSRESLSVLTVKSSRETLRNIFSSAELALNDVKFIAFYIAENLMFVVWKVT